ncbi:HAD hydrolase [Pseudomonas sp. M47T1]|uniref:HAD-IA family hydrolase n=1 Tax=unclassified Pseudomonas TaxID=196821 RepID=UPI00026083EA|nr:HAD-IA family hydrolase [Pseudomonas sp. M47T1]EIK93406.1 HAD hydrolase [Pseudomonas sp. M47T1]
MPRDYDLLIFDWDGTLADSIGRIVEAMKMAARSAGYAQRDDEAIRGIIGLALPEAILTLYPEMDDSQVVAFRQHYADCYMTMDAEPSPLFPDVLESLAAFRAAGYRLAVATGKARRGLDRVLKAHGWEAYFDITRAADETRSKPHPLMLEQILEHCQVPRERALMVGDASFDLLMARNAGIDAVAVGYGAMPLEALKVHGPVLAIERFAELHSWLSDSTN